MAASFSNQKTSPGGAARVAPDSYNREYVAPTGRSGMAQVTAVLGVLAGLWVAISPWFLTLGNRGTANDLIVGLAVAALGAFAAAGARGFLGLQAGSLLLGIWLVISPFILASTFAVKSAMYWSNGFGGLAVILFALAALAGLRHRAAVR